MLGTICDIYIGYTYLVFIRCYTSLFKIYKNDNLLFIDSDNFGRHLFDTHMYICTGKYYNDYKI